MACALGQADRERPQGGDALGAQAQRGGQHQRLEALLGQDQRLSTWDSTSGSRGSAWGAAPAPCDSAWGSTSASQGTLEPEPERLHSASGPLVAAAGCAGPSIATNATAGRRAGASGRCGRAWLARRCLRAGGCVRYEKALLARCTRAAPLWLCVSVSSRGGGSEEGRQAGRERESERERESNRGCESMRGPESESQRACACV